jgi:hypothetical protein
VTDHQAIIEWLETTYPNTIIPSYRQPMFQLKRDGGIALCSRCVNGIRHRCGFCGCDIPHMAKGSCADCWGTGQERWARAVEERA